MANANNFLNCSTEIPTVEKTAEFTKNAWISPSGQFWGFEGARHQLAAAYISVFTLGGNETTLKRGMYFNGSWENGSWEGWLYKQGWMTIKNVSWLTGESEPSTFRCSEWTERQKTTIFDYCEFFDLDYNKVIETGHSI